MVIESNWVPGENGHTIYYYLGAHCVGRLTAHNRRKLPYTVYPWGVFNFKQRSFNTLPSAADYMEMSAQNWILEGLHPDLKLESKGVPPMDYHFLPLVAARDAADE